MQHVRFNNWAREVWGQNLPRILGLPKKWRAIDRLRCLAAVVLLEMLEEESNGVTKSGKHPRGTHEASINSESLLLKQIPAKSA